MIRQTICRQVAAQVARQSRRSAVSSSSFSAVSRRLYSSSSSSSSTSSWKPFGLAAAGVLAMSNLLVKAEEPSEVIVIDEQIVDGDGKVVEEEVIVIEPVFGEIPPLRESELDAVFDSAVEEAGVDGLSSPAPAEGEGEDEFEGGAFNPKTGEINWDCPCLGGMAYGPCGEEFKAAFSCFVFSQEEPKGVNCIPLFETMQGCFRKHPETYADDLRYIDDEKEKEQEQIAAAAEPTAA